MLNQTLRQLFEREFDRLEHELKSYNDPADIWKKAKGINNSAGNLSLHLAGNLRHFIGAILGDTGYKRDREFEFNGTVSVEELLERNRLAKNEVLTTLQHIDQKSLDAMYPLDVLGKEMSTAFFLTHLYGHFNYHLGQINYHRRLLSQT